MPTFGPGWIERAALADEDLAGLDLLGAVDLHAAVLAGGVAPVARGALSFFVSHLSAPLPAGRYARTSVITTSVYGWRWPRFFVQPSFFLRKWMTFLCLAWPTISPSTAAPVDDGLADLGLALAADEQHLEGELAADVADDLLDLEPVALRDAVLLAAGPNHRVHRLLLELRGRSCRGDASRARRPALRKGGHIRSTRPPLSRNPGSYRRAHRRRPPEGRCVPLIAGRISSDPPRPCANPRTRPRGPDRPPRRRGGPGLRRDSTSICPSSSRGSSSSPPASRSSRSSRRRSSSRTATTGSAATTAGIAPGRTAAAGWSCRSARVPGRLGAVPARQVPATGRRRSGRRRRTRPR